MSEQASGPDLDTGDDPPATAAGEHPQLPPFGRVEADSSDHDAEADDPSRPARIAAWLLIVGSLALAGLFVPVPAHTYDLDLTGRVILDVRRVDFVELWRVQTQNLPDVRYEAMLQALFVVSGIVALVGSAILIWLATVEIVPLVRHDGEPEGRQSDASSSS